MNQQIPPLDRHQIYEDHDGRRVYTQRLYGCMVEYKYRGDDHIRVRTHEDFLARFRYLEYYVPPHNTLG
jgi:hypothetical protein